MMIIDRCHRHKECASWMVLLFTAMMKIFVLIRFLSIITISVNAFSTSTNTNTMKTYNKRVNLSTHHYQQQRIKSSAPLILNNNKIIRPHHPPQAAHLLHHRQHHQQLWYNPTTLCYHNSNYQSQLHAVTDDDSNNESSLTTNNNKLDQILSKLTSLFPLWVLSSAIFGLFIPSSLVWINQGQLITIMLALVMMGTGLTLEAKDFTNILLGSNVISVPMGVACQFLIMPFTAAFLGRNLLLTNNIVGSGGVIAKETAQALFLGLLLVGCSPGGTASNLVSLIAKADVALSVLLTACSTILASGVTPLLVKLLVGSTIHVSGKALVVATARVVLLPVLLGMIIQQKAPTISQKISRFTPFGSVILIALICGGVVAENASLVWSSKTVLPKVLSTVFALHAIGFSLGYMIPKFVGKRPEQTSRTISIETGMQNSALAVVLARSMGASPLAGLPGALSATMHSCLGSILAAYWLWRPPSSSSLSKKHDGDD